jgi:glycosyltransferase involved in cell wall biosynthesis
LDEFPGSVFWISDLTMQLSVVICTHNPRADYLQQVLDALKAQTLPKDQWELLLIDNASKELLATSWDLSWHPHARHIREDELGLTPARLRGIKESTGEILVFMDDDNVPAPDYLATSLEIASIQVSIAVWNGRVDPEFDQKPAEWMRPLWGALAIRPVERDCWANVYDCAEARPWGAGMCVRRKLALAYSEEVKRVAAFNILDRRGSSLMSAGDLHFASLACRLGWGMGCFRGLKLKHLIPATRLERAYLENLCENIHFSCGMLLLAEGGKIPVTGFRFRSLARFGINWLTLRGGARLDWLAYRRAAKRLQQVVIAGR